MGSFALVKRTKNITDMKRNITMTPTAYTPSTTQIGPILRQTAAALRWPLVALSRYYTAVLERPVGIRQTLLLLNAQTAFLFAAFPVSGPLVLRAVCVAWLLHAVLKCRAAL